MARTIEELRVHVAAQKKRIPSVYGNVDFSVTPERFADGPLDETTLEGEYASRRPQVLADKDLVERMRAYTMLGDVVADGYAALMPQYGFKRLISMLTDACDHGVEAVDEAPAELIAFIRDMEHVPDWLDMELVREGARIDRNAAANFAPFYMRGAFVATFMNKYAALPMALTGTLSNATAARRIKETASFFTTSVLPGALERHGPGFKAAAMVRLMHSMVRLNILTRLKQWDVSVYGIPIPQVDQMPAGLISIFLMSYKILDAGRKEFTRQERARVELARYRCYLLGLPEELLPDTPEGIVKVMTARGGTLRKGYDDNTCGELLRATMAAYLPEDESIRSRIYNALERPFSKIFFVRGFLSGDMRRASDMGLKLSRKDQILAMVCALFLMSRMKAYSIALRIPMISAFVDKILVRKVRALLVKYGHAEYTTDVSQYRPVREVRA